MKISFNYLIILFLFLGSAGFATNKTDLKKFDEHLFVNDLGYHSKASPFADCPNSVTNNIITADLTTICGEGSVSFSGSVPTITPSTDSTFQWQSKTTGDWTNISGATGIDYVTNTLNKTTSFRRLVVVADCTTDYPSNAIEVTVNPIPNAPGINVTDECGQSLLTATGYEDGAALIWSNDSTGASIVVTSAGTYTVTQTVNGCTSPESNSATAAPKTAPTLSATRINPTNCGDQGSINFTFTNVPEGPQTVSYNGGTQTLNVNVSSSGTASVLVDAGTYQNLTISINGCASTENVNITISDPNPPAAPGINVTDECGQSVLTATGYEDGAALIWSNDSTGASIVVTSAGTYTVTQTVNGCTSPESNSATAAPKTAPTLSATIINPTNCGDQGSIDFTFTNVPEGSQTVNYDGGALNVNVSASGTASVSVDAGTYENLGITINGCASTENVNITISDPNPPAAPGINVTDECGQSVLTATGYEDGAALIWSNDSTGASIVVTSAGTYTVTQTVNGCTSPESNSATAAPKTAPTLSATRINPTNCGDQGSIDFTFTNVPEGSQTVNYDGGTLNVNVSASGTASVSVDAGTYENLGITINGCASTENVNITISDPNPPAAPGINVTDECGQSVLTATGYEDGAALIWSNDSTGASIVVTSAGTYTVTQTVNGCTSPESNSATAAPKTAPTLSATIINPTNCGDQGSIDFTFTNVPEGSQTVNYDGGALNVNVSASGTASVSVDAGTYENLGITINGCASTENVDVTISDPSPPAAPVIDVTDECGQSVLTATGYEDGAALIWSNDSTGASIVVTSAGTYTVTQTVNGCTSLESNSATAAPKTIPAITNVSANNPTTCQGTGSLDFTFSDVPNGTYSIVSDDITFSDVVVTDNAAIVQAAAGTYNNLKITVNGCPSANGVNASLSDPTPPAAPTGNQIQSFCSSESPIVEDLVVDGTNINWYSNQEGTSPLQISDILADETTYYATQTVNGCESATLAVTTEILTTPAITNITENDPTTCQGTGSLDFTFSDVPDGTYSIAYDGSSFSDVEVSGNEASVQTAAGAYNNLRITVDDCTSANGVNASLSDPNPPSAPSILVQDNCGESVLTASNYTGNLLWSTGENTESISVNEAGNYSLTQLLDGCTSDAVTATATPKKIPVITNVKENNPTTCQGIGSLDFTFTNVPNGTYPIAYGGGSSFTGVEVFDNKASVEAPVETYNNLKIAVDGCISANGVSASLSSANPPAAPTITVQDNCGESILTASNYTGNLLWSTGENTESIIVNEDGNYSLTQFLDGCTSDVATASATPKTIPAIASVTEDNPITCLGTGSLDFTFNDVTNGTYTIAYDGGSFKGVEIFGNTASVQAPVGTYNNLKITVDGCTSVNGVSANLTFADQPSAPTITVEDNCGESVLTASNYTGDLLWSTGENTESIIVNEAGNYSLTQVIDGCKSYAASASATPKIIPVITNVIENSPTTCQGTDSLDFTFTGVPNGTYTIFYDGNSFKGVEVFDNIASIQAPAGTYNNLKITVDGCTSTDGVNASLSDPNPPPAPNISVEDKCGESVLTASNYTGNLLWSNGESTESITVTAPGNYSLTQNVNGCTSNAVSAVATPETSSLQPDIVVENNCGESKITVNNLTEDAWLYWQFNNTTDSIQSENIIVTENGDYTVYQKVGNCASSKTIVTVSPLVIPSPPSGINKEICSTIPIQPLIAEATTDDSNTDVFWYDEATGGNEVLLPVLDTIGTVTFYAEANNAISGCSSDSRTPVKLTIKPNPKETLIDTAIIGKPKANVAVLIFPDNSLQYQWYLNDSEIINATNQYYYLNESERQNGNIFSVEVAFQNGCKSKFNYPYSVNSIGNEFNAFKNSELTDTDKSFTVYPNPVSNNLYISISAKDSYLNQKLNAKIYSITGASILEKPLDKNPQSIDIRHLRPGFYSIAITSEGKRLFTKKLVITNR